MNPLLERISIDPNICFGKPRIRGTWIWAQQLLGFLAGGATNVLAVIACGTEMSREQFVDLLGSSAA